MVASVGMVKAAHVLLAVGIAEGAAVAVEVEPAVAAAAVAAAAAAVERGAAVGEAGHDQVRVASILAVSEDPALTELGLGTGTETEPGTGTGDRVSGQLGTVVVVNMEAGPEEVPVEVPATG